MNEPAFKVAITTVSKAEDAERIAEALVERKLAACVNILSGVRSVYRWQGETCRDDEWLLLIKTEQARIEALKAGIAELHPYDCPELIVLPIVDGSADYLSWLAGSLSADGS